LILTNTIRQFHFKKLFVLQAFIFCLLQSSATIAQENIISLGAGNYFIDNNLKLILCPLAPNLFNQLIEGSVSAIEADEIYSLENLVYNFETGIPYLVSRNEIFYTFYFTSFPVFSIETGNNDLSSEHIPAQFKMCDDAGNYLNSWIGINVRGGTSTYFPKKSYRIEFWQNESGDATRNVSLLGLRNDDDWILLSLYTEPLRLRNMTCHTLWNKLHRPYYQEIEPEMVAGARLKYVELFANGSYLGLYGLCERVDRKQLKLQSYEESPLNYGELFKAQEYNSGLVTYDFIAPYNNNNRWWDGYEMKYPEEELITDWGGFYSYKLFVLQSSVENFKEDVGNFVEMSNSVDYFIFLNVLRAIDNTGKNIFMSRYNQVHPYFITPWDLDATLGMFVDGTRLPEFTGILSNGLYNRLLADCDSGGFINQLNNRWIELRSGLLHTDSLINTLVSNYHLLKFNDNYTRESMVWGGLNQTEEDLSYTIDWIYKRLNYLDVQFENLCSEVAYVPSTIPAKTKLYPNPVDRDLYVFHNTFNTVQTYSIINILGERLITGTNQNHTTIIDVKNLKPGLYFFFWESLPANTSSFIKL